MQTINAVNYDETGEVLRKWTHLNRSSSWWVGFHGNIIFWLVWFSYFFLIWKTHFMGSLLLLLDFNVWCARFSHMKDFLFSSHANGTRTLHTGTMLYWYTYFLVKNKLVSKYTLINVTWYTSFPLYTGLILKMHSTSGF